MSKQRKYSNEYIRERAVSWCTIHSIQKKKKNKKWKMLDYFLKKGGILLLKNYFHLKNPGFRL